MLKHDSEDDIDPQNLMELDFQLAKNLQDLYNEEEPAVLSASITEQANEAPSSTAGMVKMLAKR